nr:u3 small nucleolar rna-associated protein 17 [Quercus suber]
MYEQMARRNKDSTTEGGKKRKLENGETDRMVHKKPRAGTDAAGLPLRSSGNLEKSRPRVLSTGQSEAAATTPKTKATFRATEDDGHHMPTRGKLSHLTEEEKAHRQRRREIKREKRQARAAAAAAEKKADPAKALANKQSRKQKFGHDRPLWTFSSPTAGRILDQDPVFVRSSGGTDHLVVATEVQVQLLSQETSTIIKTSSAPQGSVVQCLATSLVEDGVVFIAFSNGSVHKWEVDVEEPARYIATSRGIPMAVAELPVTGNDVHRLLCLARVGETYSLSLGDKSIFETSLRLNAIIVAEDGRYVVLTGCASVVIGLNKSSLNGPPDFTWVEVPVLKTITCADVRLMPLANNVDGVEVQRRGLRLLLGYADGEIHLFEDISGLFDGVGKPVFPSPRTLHWHRGAVSSAKFSRDGNYIISGGMETVLVLWQLSTGNKSYLPHLTSAILHIVVGTLGDRYALQMGDNSVMVLSTSELKPVANFAGLQLAALKVGQKSNASKASQPKTVAVTHTLDSDQLLITVPASQPKNESDLATRPFLQTFDLRLSKHINRQALTRNNVTDFGSTPDGVPIQPPDVHLLQISRDGQWLATVDQWMPPAADLTHLASDTHSILTEERHKRREVYLKFWSWDQQQNIWTLTTRVDAPHTRSSGANGAGEVFDLTADPSSTSFATIGEDRCVHIWRAKLRVRNGMRMKSPNGEDLVEWACKRTVDLIKESPYTESLISSEELQTRAEGYLAYSEDGSVIAAATTQSSLAHPPLIHFIDSNTGAVTPRTKISISDLTNFGFLDRYFVVVSRREVYVWDLITETLLERSRLPGGDGQVTPILTVNQSGHTIAVAAGSNISTYDVILGRWVSNVFTGTPVTSLLSKGRGYVVLTTDASVRMLTPSTIANRQLALPEGSETMEAEVDKGISGTPNEIEYLLADNREDHFDNSRGMLLEDTEDDRPVVRPEQLTTIFDVGQSFAMPPVKDMFGAVVGLFGRKPRVVQPIS